MVAGSLTPALGVGDLLVRAAAARSRPPPSMVSELRLIPCDVGFGFGLGLIIVYD